MHNSAKVANGQSQTQSSGLQEDISRQAEQGMRSAANDASVTETIDGSVKAKWGEVVRDEQGNPTKIGVSCDITCRKNAADFSKFTSDDIAMSAMITSFRASQRETVELLSYQAVAIAGGGYFGARIAITYGNYIALPAYARNACIGLTFECLSVLNSAKKLETLFPRPKQSDAGWVYDKLRPKDRMGVPQGGKPKIRLDSSGNPIMFRDMP